MAPCQVQCSTKLLLKQRQRGENQAFSTIINAVPNTNYHSLKLFLLKDIGWPSFSFKKKKIRLVLFRMDTSLNLNFLVGSYFSQIKRQNSVKGS